MKLHVITICLDSMPTLPSVFYALQASNTDWHWHVSEGPAANVGCTSWCRPQPWRNAASPSKDGTSEFLDSLKNHSRVTVKRRGMWQGKLEMFNVHLPEITEECVLLECDSDELWRAEQLEDIERMFTELPHIQRAYFDCWYYVGPNIVTTTTGAYGHNPGEWLRAWRFKLGMMFDRHEPPVLAGNLGTPADISFTSARGLAFHHFAYAYESQVAFKEKFYGYADAVTHWKRLQSNQVWPVARLKDFLPWVDDRATACLLFGANQTSK